MSVTKIRIPDDQIDAIRDSLRVRRDELRDASEQVEASRRLGDITDLLEQIEGGRPAELTGSRAVLWAAAYDVLCAGAERLAADCNELWRGADFAETRAQLSILHKRLDLLELLGPPPAEGA